MINLLQEPLRQYDIQQTDETSLQVLEEDGKKAQSKSYLWIQCGGPPRRHVIIFTYDSSRSQHKSAKSGAVLTYPHHSRLFFSNCRTDRRLGWSFAETQL
ncbi:transposase [Methylobacter sp.]|uniref:IS66 family transposase n=1 Tax=Methylobacter sp. TaxID=2051955 RepID=UPI00338F3D39